MKKSIAIIGCGNIGNRWLQSFLDYLNKWIVYVVESDIRCLEARKQDYAGQSIVFLDKISDLPDHLELCAIATTSKVRRNVFDELLINRMVDNVIFEKVLFQRIDDYYHVSKLLCEKGIKAWVNHTRRETEAYKKLKKRLGNPDTISINVEGSEWGLCCNGLHMIDLVAFLSGKECLPINTTGIISKPIESKRRGYYELYGTISGACEGVRYSVTCTQGMDVRDFITISTGKGFYLIDEITGNMIFEDEENGWKWEKVDFKLEYTSQIMGKIVYSILENGDCGLPKYENSMDLHLKLLGGLMNIFEDENMEEGVCPIT